MSGNNNQLIEDFKKSCRGGQFFERLFSVIPNSCFFIKNINSQFVAADEKFVKHLGKNSLDEILGKTDYDFHPEFLAKKIIDDDKHIISTGKSIINKIELIPSHGLIPDWNMSTKIPLFGNDGKIIGIAGVTCTIPSSDPIYTSHPELSKCVSFVKENYTRRITIKDMAKIADVSISSLERIFQKTFKITPIKYLKKVRLNAVCKALRFTDENISEIAKKCGFYDQSILTKNFKGIFKITPLQYRKKHAKKR